MVRLTDCEVWTSCYDGGWQGLLVPEAFSHPAKFSYRLICRIVQHLYEMGWVQRGDVVCDPFGGVGTGGIVCGYQGLRWVGCELEPRFVGLARQNFELHRGRMEAAGDFLPQIVQGDSRRLASVLAGAGYGQTAGQLGRLKAGEVGAVVSSPPYWDSKVGGNDPEVERGRVARKIASGEIDPATAGKYSKNSQDVLAQYGDDPNNLGNRDQETFWAAARDIVAQCHAILRPTGTAHFVTKNFVRAKAIVPFTDDWIRLCEACGFRLVCRHRAMLVKEQDVPTLFNGTEKKTKARKSFFRRLAESKGSPPIDWEEVTCFVRA